ncbi:MAG: formate dehydrogenase accessory protein FdhE [Desulfobacteraceae bacterium]|jgi:FdhE protein
MITAGRTDILEHIHQSFQAAAKSLPAYAHILPFFETLFTLQEAAVARASPDPAPMGTKGIKSGLPLLDRAHIPYDEAAAVNLLLAICREADTATYQLAEGAAALLYDLGNKGGAVQRGLRLFMGADHQGLHALSAELNMDASILHFFLYHGTWPSVARQVGWILDSDALVDIQWDQGSCPVCGSAPDLAYLAENGGRRLVCGFCRHQWPLRRICCPYCGNQDSHSVIFFFSDPEPAYRIYTCKVCKRYIKTVDTRRLARPFYPPLEGIVTAHLDLKTRGLGFRSQPSCCTEMAV